MIDCFGWYYPCSYSASDFVDSSCSPLPTFLFISFLCFCNSPIIISVSVSHYRQYSRRHHHCRRHHHQYRHHYSLITYIVAAPGSKESDSLSDRMYNGYYAYENSPYVTKLLVGWEPSCSGVIINSDTVLTAASCFYSG